MAVVNSFVLYRLIHGSNFILIKDFRRAFAATYLKLGHGSKVMRICQLSLPSTSRTQVAHDLCLDQQNYMHGKREALPIPKLQGQTSRLLCYVKSSIICILLSKISLAMH